jgi:O-methyltransferase
VDDYGAIEGCRAAVDDFLDTAGIRATLTSIDWTGVFWRKTGS